MQCTHPHHRLIALLSAAALLIGVLTLPSAQVAADDYGVVVLGGPSAVSEDVIRELEDLTTGDLARLSGDNRFETAAAVSAWAFDPGVAVAYVAIGTDFPDALAGGPVAGLQGGPVLLVTADDIPQATADELQRLQPQRIVVLGGTAVISPQVEVALAAYTDGNVDRLAGPDRYATAAAVSASHFTPGVDLAYVATGLDFPDALAGVPAAVVREAPILLTAPDSLPQATADELARLQPDTITILGGTSAVSDAVAAELTAHATDTVGRIAGTSRADTAAEIAGVTFGDDPPVVYVATAGTYPDALAGGPAAALAGGPILLTNPDALPPETVAQLGGAPPPSGACPGPGVGETIPSGAVRVSESSGDFDGDGAVDRIVTYGMGATEDPDSWHVRMVLDTGYAAELDLSAEVPDISAVHGVEPVGSLDIGAGTATAGGVDTALVWVGGGASTRLLSLFALVDCDVVWVRQPAGAEPVTRFPVGGAVTHGDGVQCRDVNGDRLLDLVDRSATSEDGETYDWAEVALRRAGERLDGRIDGTAGWADNGVFESPEDDARIAAFYDLTCPQRTGGLVFQPDGFDLVDFGTATEDALATLVDELGAPDADSGPQQFPGCPGTEQRVVRWGPVEAWFTDESRYGNGDHLASYEIVRQATGGDPWLLSTPEGVGLDSTIPELQAAFGSRLTVDLDGPLGPTFEVRDEGAPTPDYLGLFSDTDPRIVTWLGAGHLCGE